MLSLSQYIGLFDEAFGKSVTPAINPSLQLTLEKKNSSQIIALYI